MLDMENDRKRRSKKPQEETISFSDLMPKPYVGSPTTISLFDGKKRLATVTIDEYLKLPYDKNGDKIWPMGASA